MEKMLAEGVTLIEMMVTVAMTGIILTLGVPAVRDIIATNRMSAAANDVITTLHIARNEAAKEGQPVIICASSNWNQANPTCGEGQLQDGWIVFMDRGPNSNGAPDPDEKIVQGHGPLGDGIELTAPNRIMFTSLGRPSTNQPDANVINFLLCDDRGNRVSGGVTAARLVTVTPTGRPHVHTSPADVVCAG